MAFIAPTSKKVTTSLVLSSYEPGVTRREGRRRQTISTIFLVKFIFVKRTMVTRFALNIEYRKLRK